MAERQTRVGQQRERRVERSVPMSGDDREPDEESRDERRGRRNDSSARRTRRAALARRRYPSGRRRSRTRSVNAMIASDRGLRPPVPAGTRLARLAGDTIGFDQHLTICGADDEGVGLTASR